MKICIWCTKIFDLGGTKRVVTLLANELVKEHDVTIMVYQDRFKEDRNMYHMSEISRLTLLIIMSLSIDIIHRLSAGVILSETECQIRDF